MNRRHTYCLCSVAAVFATCLANSSMAARVLQDEPTAKTPLPGGASQDWWNRVQRGLTECEYHASENGEGLQAPNRAHNLRTYFEKDIPLLLEDLFSASRTIGFNIRRFDYEVLRGYTSRPVGGLQTLDLLEEVQQAAGHRVSLGSLLEETLHTSKAGHGSQAIDWYENGEWERLEAYCREDVRATKTLYEHGCKHRTVSFWDRREHRARSVPVHW